MQLRLADLFSGGLSLDRLCSCATGHRRHIASVVEFSCLSDLVGANYAERSILLPTVSNKPRLTPAEREDYFRHFLEDRPSGKIDLHFVEIGCNTAVDAGLYTFKFAKTGAVVSGRYSYTYRWDGSKWLITSHHSSAMPEKK
jgi:hypothetical protein